MNIEIVLVKKRVASRESHPHSGPTILTREMSHKSQSFTANGMVLQHCNGPPPWWGVEYLEIVLDSAFFTETAARRLRELVHLNRLNIREVTIAALSRHPQEANPRDIASMLETCTKLRTLHIRGPVRNLMPIMASPVLTSNLEKLVLTNPRGMEMQSVCLLIGAAKKLRELTITSQIVLEDMRELETSLSVNTSLESLDIHMLSSVDEGRILASLAGHPTIGHIALETMPPNAADVIHGINGPRDAARKERRDAIVALLHAYGQGAVETTSPLHWLPLEIVQMIIKHYYKAVPPPPAPCVVRSIYRQ